MLIKVKNLDKYKEKSYDIVRSKSNNGCRRIGMDITKTTIKIGNLRKY